MSIIHRFCLLLVVLMLGASIATAQEATYRVQPGDTLQGIAHVYGVSVQDILARNQLTHPNHIEVGQVLIIPRPGSPIAQTHTVGYGESLTDIAYLYGTTVDALVQANLLGNPNYITPGQVLTIPTSAQATLGTTPAGTSAPTLPAQPLVYQVDRGETLQTIAAMFGTTWQTLAAANNIPNPNYIQAGQFIVIPNATTPVMQPAQPPHQPVPIVQTTYPVYIVRAGDTLSQIAEHFGVTVEGIRQLNGITNNRHIFPGDRLLIPTTHVVPPPPPPHIPRVAPGGVYHVRAGDTLLAIAASFGVDVFDLARANGIFNLNSIFVGQRLVIPGLHH